MNFILKKTLHGQPGYILSLISSFDSKENKNNLYREKDCMERFCKDLKNQEMKIINYKQKEMIPLKDNENRSYEKKNCYICKKQFLLIKMIRTKLEITVITQENLEEMFIIFVI